MSLRGKRTPRLFALFRWSLASCLGQTRNSWPAGPALSSNILHQTAIKFRPPITEKAHSRAVFERAVQIERCYQCSRFLRTGFGNEVARSEERSVGKEGVVRVDLGGGRTIQKKTTQTLVIRSRF